MTANKLNPGEKQAELEKYCALVIATIDYYLDNKLMHINTPEFDSTQHFQSLKMQAEEHYNKGRLTKLKQWFRDLTEMQVETGDLRFNKYLQEKTGYETDIFISYFQRVDKILEKGKISSDNQFYGATMMVDRLCQTEPVDTAKINILNQLIADYQRTKTR